MLLRYKHEEKFSWYSIISVTSRLCRYSLLRLQRVQCCQEVLQGQSPFILHMLFLNVRRCGLRAWLAFCVLHLLASWRVPASPTSQSRPFVAAVAAPRMSWSTGGGHADCKRLRVTAMEATGSRRLDKAARDNRANQLNPNHKASKSQGAGKHKNLERTANGLPDATCIRCVEFFGISLSCRPPSTSEEPAS